ncbi:MAG: phospholipid carrier-dependent glycosyltransferase [Planctomycetota bacterium]
MTEPPDAERTALARHALIVTAVCALAFGWGLTTHGLTNWQEAIRVVVARSMQAAGDWIVPIVDGQPYLAKPPLIYWAQLVSASIRGAEVSIFDLRLVVALSGWIAALLTLVAARTVLFDARALDPGTARARAHSAALWAAVLLATGVLHVRSSRIGELDILLTPFTVLGVWGVFRAWRASLGGARVDWLGIALACVGSAGAALTKGPPGVLTLLLAGYGGIALHAAFGSHIASPRGAFKWVPLVCALAGALAGGYAASRDADDLRAWIGALLIACCTGSAAWLVARFVQPQRLKELLRAWWRTGLPLAILASVGVLAVWSAGVARSIGAEAIEQSLNAEVSENVRVLRATAPIRNFEGMLYAVGLGSGAMLAALVWILKDRPRLPLGAWTLAGWVGLTFVAFSTLGTGSSRYLTPVWSGVAMLGALWLVELFHDRPGLARRLRPALAVLVALLALGQGVWYAIGREVYAAHRSPRDFIAALQEASVPLTPERVKSIDFWTAAVEYYVGGYVEPLRLEGYGFDSPLPAEHAADAAQRATGDDPYVLLVRALPTNEAGEPRALDALRDAGWRIGERLPAEASSFRIEGGDIPISAYSAFPAERRSEPQ